MKRGPKDRDRNIRLREGRRDGRGREGEGVDGSAARGKNERGKDGRADTRGASVRCEARTGPHPRTRARMLPLQKVGINHGTLIAAAPYFSSVFLSN